MQHNATDRYICTIHNGGKKKKQNARNTGCFATVPLLSPRKEAPCELAQPTSPPPPCYTRRLAPLLWTNSRRPPLFRLEPYSEATNGKRALSYLLRQVKATGQRSSLTKRTATGLGAAMEKTPKPDMEHQHGPLSLSP